MRKKLKVYFTDFWNNFNTTDNLFLTLLKKDYDVEYTSEDPDILFYSLFGSQHHRYKCKKVFFTGENERPDFSECDFAFTFDYSDDPRNYRLPLYVLFGNVYDLTKPRDPEQLMENKTGFCNFVYSNPSATNRKNFFHKLSEYKKVDAGGRVLNNIGYLIPDKLEFISKYKFTIAYENEDYPGYTTEKLFEPLTVGSIPIYWGNKYAYKDFNKDAFLHRGDFDSDEALIEKIKEIDNNDELWRKYLAAPPFPDNKVNEYVDHDNLHKRLIEIVEADIKPVAFKSKVFSSNPLISKLSLLKHDLDYKIYFYRNKIKKFSFERLNHAFEHKKRMSSLKKS